MSYPNWLGSQPFTNHWEELAQEVPVSSHMVIPRWFFFFPMGSPLRLGNRLRTYLFVFFYFLQVKMHPSEIDFSKALAAQPQAGCRRSGRPFLPEWCWSLETQCCYLWPWHGMCPWVWTISSVPKPSRRFQGDIPLILVMYSIVMSCNVINHPYGLMVYIVIYTCLFQP